MIKKLVIWMVALVSSLVLLACEKRPNPIVETEDPIVIRQLNTPQDLVGFLLDYTIQGTKEFIYDDDIKIALIQTMNNQILEVHGEAKNIAFEPSTDRLTTHQGSYKHLYSGSLFGSVNIPIEYYFIERQNHEVYAIKSELKKYRIVTIDSDQFNTYLVIDKSLRTYESNQYYSYLHESEYTQYNQINLGSIIQGFFINLCSNAFISDYETMKNGQYDYNLLKNFQLNQTDSLIELSFEAIDLDGLSYGTDSGLAVYTTVSGILDVQTLEIHLDIDYKVYKNELLWNEAKYQFSLTRNVTPIVFTPTQDFVSSIDVR
jgi:hypothetical protein